MNATPTYLILLACSTLSGCMPDRDLLFPEPINDTTLNTAANLVINEVVAAGSLNVNEFGTAEDWIELYNPTSVALTIGPNEWYITDESGVNNLKYALPPMVVPAHGFVLLWCDDRDTLASAIHTNFKLSSTGEDLGLYRMVDGAETKVIERNYTPALPGGQSEGSYPDGSIDWTVFAQPTPGDRNQ